MTLKPNQLLEKYRRNMAGKVRSFRLARRWTQAELAARLGISQGRLSELERGDGSFSAEQLVVLLQVFNVTIAELVAERPAAEEGLQNTLARLGAKHLVEAPDVLPSDWVDDVERSIREALATGVPRLVTALAPVLVRHVERVNVVKLRAALAEVGIQRRLDWLLENVLAAIEIELRDERLPRSITQSYRRVQTELELARAFVSPRSADGEGILEGEPRRYDLLDPQVRTMETANDLLASASPIAKRWGIITALTERDFADALRAARVAV